MTPLHYKRLWLLKNKKKKNYTYSNGDCLEKITGITLLFILAQSLLK